MKQIIVTVDGYSSSGKSSMAKWLAQKTGYTYIDTGAMYRAVTLYALDKNYFEDDGSINQEKLQSDLASIDIRFIINPVTGCSETILNGENVEKKIRGMNVANKVSSMASLPFVRTFLVEKQQRMGVNKAVVMDGRDIGTVVFPDAELKFFVTATPEIRAERRYKELEGKGEPVSYDEILNNIKNRDFQDENRAVSPLKKAVDAIELDNTNMTIEEQQQWMLEHFNRIAENDRGRNR
jgi:cytidylate kinase